MQIAIDQNFNNIENTLSFIAAFPVAGILAGAVKIILGGFQAITALVCSILILIPVLITGDWDSFNYAVSHIAHGVGNILAAILEAFPLLGTIMFLFRITMASSGSDSGAYIRTGHENKWMPYSSLVENGLVEHEWYIDGAISTDVDTVREKIDKEIDKNGGVSLLTKKQQLNIVIATVKGMSHSFS